MEVLKKQKPIELNEHGLQIWKHKTNKRLFLFRAFSWIDNLSLLDETEGRQLIDEYQFSTYNFSAWEPMTKEEYSRVKRFYKEIYDPLPPPKLITKTHYLKNRYIFTLQSIGELSHLIISDKNIYPDEDSRSQDYWRLNGGLTIPINDRKDLSDFFYLLKDLIDEN